MFEGPTQARLDPRLEQVVDELMRRLQPVCLSIPSGGPAPPPAPDQPRSPVAQLLHESYLRLGTIHDQIQALMRDRLTI